MTCQCATLKTALKSDAKPQESSPATLFEGSADGRELGIPPAGPEGDAGEAGVLCKREPFSPGLRVGWGVSAHPDFASRHSRPHWIQSLFFCEGRGPSIACAVLLILFHSFLAGTGWVVRQVLAKPDWDSRPCWLPALEKTTSCSPLFCTALRLLLLCNFF